MGRVTLQTIADRVGVSRMTVSNAFSKPDELSAGLRERILSVADELGYAGPDPTARALTRGSAGAVGVMLTDSLRYALTDEIAMGFLGAIADELAPTGLALTLVSATPRGGIVPARDVAMDGALVYSCATDSSAVDWLMRRRIPLVFVDQAPAPHIPSVNIDDRLGAEAAARHLAELGHRRVAIVTSAPGGEHGVVDDPLRASHVFIERERMQGWLDGLSAAGIAPIALRQEPAEPEEAGYAAGQILLADRHSRPTAVLCFSDVMAFGVVKAARAVGLRVPEDLSVVGFDDNPLAARMQPALTTVRQDVRAKGRAAVAALMSALEQSRTESGAGRSRHLVLPTELVVRDSTAPPRRQTG